MYISLLPPGKWWYVEPRDAPVAFRTSPNDAPGGPCSASRRAAPEIIRARTSPLATHSSCTMQTYIVLATMHTTIDQA